MSKHYGVELDYTNQERVINSGPQTPCELKWLLCNYCEAQIFRGAAKHQMLYALDQLLNESLGGRAWNRDAGNIHDIISSYLWHWSQNPDKEDASEDIYYGLSECKRYLEENEHA